MSSVAGRVVLSGHRGPFVIRCYSLLFLPTRWKLLGDSVPRFECKGSRRFSFSLFGMV